MKSALSANLDSAKARPAAHAGSTVAADVLPTAATAAHERLRTDILRGVLAPSAKLRVNDIAERYACGVIPMREALNRLAAESLVVYSEKRGFAVAPISAAGLEDLTRARAMLLEVAIRESVRHGDEAWEERIVLSHHRLAKTPRYLDDACTMLNPVYDRLHREFHSALVSGCGSQWIVSMCEELFDHAERYRSVSRQHLPQPREDEHRAIVDAVLARRAELAIELSRAHVEATRHSALRAIESA